MFNRLVRAFQRRKKLYLILLCLLFVIYYFFMRNPDMETLTKPTFSIRENKIYEETEVYLESVEDADIYYEIIDLKKGNDEDIEVNLLSNKFSLQSPIKLKYDTEIKILAFAYKKGYNDSKIAKQIYKIQRKAEKPTISVYNNNSVALSGDFGSEIYYSLDGTIPDPESKNTIKYTGRFDINDTTTIQAIAVRKNYFPSSVTSKEIVIEKKEEIVEEEKKEEIKYYTLKTAVKGKGNIINRENNLGYTIKIEAIPEDGWEFVGWSGDISGNSKTQNINMVNKTGANKPKNVIAIFKKIVTHYDYYISTEGDGKVEENNSGDTLKIEAIPEDGWEFIRWSGDIFGTQYTKNINLISNEKNPDRINIIAEFKEVESINEMTFDLPLKLVKIIKDGQTKVLLSQYNNSMYLYKLKRDKGVRWKDVNKIIFKKQFNFEVDPVDIIADNDRYIIIGNHKEYPYLININKDFKNYSIYKLNLRNTEAKTIKKYGDNFIIGGTNNKNNQRKVSITLVDDKSNIIWNKLSYNKENNTPFENLSDLSIDRSNNIIAIGSTIDKVNKNIFLSKLSSEEVIQEKTIGSKNNDIGLLIDSINDDLIIAAESNNIYQESLDDHNGYNILIEKRDKDYNLFSRNIIGGSEDYYPADLKINDDYIYLLGNNVEKNSMVLTRLDNNLFIESKVSLDYGIGVSMLINQDTIDIITTKNNQMKLLTINLNTLQQGR